MLVAQDPESRHLAQPVPPEAPAGPGEVGREGAEGRGREGASRAAVERTEAERRGVAEAGHVRNSRLLPETAEGRWVPSDNTDCRGGGASPARGGAQLRSFGP